MHNLAFEGSCARSRAAPSTPRSAPAYVAMCHYLFDTADDFMAAFLPHAAELQGDMPNCTDIETIIQISEVAISR